MQKRLPSSLSLSLSPNKNTTILRISFPRVDSIVTYRECNQMENAEGSIFRGDLEGFRETDIFPSREESPFSGKYFVRRIYHRNRGPVIT